MQEAVGSGHPDRLLLLLLLLLEPWAIPPRMLRASVGV